MSARRCSTCGINYPASGQQLAYALSQVCPLHKTPLDLISDEEPDEDWKAKLERLKLQIDTAGESAPLIPMAEAAVLLRDGQLWVSSHDLIRSGLWDSIGTFQLIQIGKQIFEIQAYYERTRDYWVRSFSMELSDEELRRLADSN